MEQDIYRTRDQWLAAFIVAIGGKLLRVEANTRIVYFILANPGGSCERAADEFKHGEALVPARDICDAVRDVRWARLEAQDRAREQASTGARERGRQANRFQIGGVREWEGNARNQGPVGGRVAAR